MLNEDKVQNCDTARLTDNKADKHRKLQQTATTL